MDYRRITWEEGFAVLSGDRTSEDNMRVYPSFVGRGVFHTCPLNCQWALGYPREKTSSWPRSFSWRTEVGTEAELPCGPDGDAWNLWERKPFSLPGPRRSSVTTRRGLPQHLESASCRVSELLKKGRWEVKLPQKASWGATAKGQVKWKGGLVSCWHTRL